MAEGRAPYWVVIRGSPAHRITTKLHAVNKLLDKLWEVGVDPNEWSKKNIKPWMWEDETWLDFVIAKLAKLTNTYVRIIFY
jgi:hypothetical protein